MSEIQVFGDNLLAQQIDAQVQEAFAGLGEVFPGLSLQAITNEELLAAVEDTVSADIRIKGVEGNRPMFNGLSFDESRVSGQAYALVSAEQERPVGVMNLMVLPPAVTASLRYLRYNPETDEVLVNDLNGALESTESPGFTVVPGWSFLYPEYRGNVAIARPALKAMTAVVDTLAANAPENTNLMIEQRGNFPFAQRQILQELTVGNVGDVLSPEKLNIQMTEILGVGRMEIGAIRTGKAGLVIAQTNKNVAAALTILETLGIDPKQTPGQLDIRSIFAQPNKNASVPGTGARMLGMTRLPNIAHIHTLGPVHARRLK